MGANEDGAGAAQPEAESRPPQPVSGLAGQHRCLGTLTASHARCRAPRPPARSHPLTSPPAPKPTRPPYQALRDAGVKMVAPQEVAFAMEAGSHKIVDVRPAKLYEDGHLAGAVSVEYYRPIQGWCA
jgi:hypothetical protein